MKSRTTPLSAPIRDTTLKTVCLFERHTQGLDTHLAHELLEVRRLGNRSEWIAVRLPRIQGPRATFAVSITLPPPTGMMTSLGRLDPARHAGANALVGLAAKNT